jgi:hypothetical protein
MGHDLRDEAVEGLELAHRDAAPAIGRADHGRVHQLEDWALAEGVRDDLDVPCSSRKSRHAQCARLVKRSSSSGTGRARRTRGGPPSAAVVPGECGCRAAEDDTGTTLRGMPGARPADRSVRGGRSRAV